MTQVKINGKTYTAYVTPTLKDPDFGGRSTKTIALEMSTETAQALFVDNLDGQEKA